jgi:signal peptidase I
MTQHPVSSTPTDGSTGGPSAHDSERDAGSPEPTEPSPLAGTVSVAPRTQRPVNRQLRGLFYVIWSVVVPLAAALATVWLFTPDRSAVQVGALRAAIGEQKIPATILFFVVYVGALWRLRHELPLATAAGVGGRRDVPSKLRGRYDDAEALLEEARGILKAKRREIERELTSAEREELTEGLDELERTMTAETFSPAAFEKALGRADRLIGDHLARWRKGEIREYAESIAIAVVVALVLRAFVVEAFKIPSGSMIPTLMVGDHIFVNKLSYGPLVPFTDTRLVSSLPPSRGDVMVFKFPENPAQDFIKRVIAHPGDRLEVVDGRPIINGWPVPRCRVGTYEHDGRSGELFVEHLGETSYLTLFDMPTSEQTCSQAADCPPGLGCYAGVCGSDYRSYKVAPNELWVMGDNRNNSHDSRSWNLNRGGGVPFENVKGRAMFVFATFGPSGGMADRLLVNVMGRPVLPVTHRHLQPKLDACLSTAPKSGGPPPAR